MKLLLDTHALLWFFDGDERLPVPVRALIADPGNDVSVSVGSLWETAIKVALGKLTLTEPFDVLFPPRLAQEQINVLPVHIAHLTRLLQLPLYHRDPFDRLIVAQSLSEGLPLISRDAAFDAYGVQRLWDAEATP